MRKELTVVVRGFVLALLLLLVAGPASAYETVEPGETQVFTTGDRCDGTPFLDTLLKGTNSTCGYSPARVEAAAILSVSAINNDVTAYSTSFTDFLVSGSNGSVLDATVSATVDWDGVLFGAGILGAGASVKLEMLLVDETDGAIKASTVVLNKRQDSTGLKGIDVGGTRVRGAEDVSLQGTVVRGHQHSIQLKVTCSAESGLIGLDVGCIFMNDVFGINLGGDPHAKWTSLSITVEQDIFDRLDQIDAKLLEIEGKVDALDERFDLVDAKLLEIEGKIDTLDERTELMDAKLNEVIRLLLTPQGRRSSDFLDCAGEDCDFPVSNDDPLPNDDSQRRNEGRTARGRARPR
jgi:hypothetical protein